MKLRRLAVALTVSLLIAVLLPMLDLPTVPLAEASSGNFKVEDGYDDAMEREGGSFFYQTPTYYIQCGGGTYYCAGLRFPDITIPRGSIILSANMSVYVDNVEQDDVNCMIYGNDVDDAQDFYVNQNIINQTERPRTSASVGWYDTSMGVGWYEKTGLESIIQEIVGRDDWTENNAIALLFIASETGTECAKMKAYDESLIYAAKLDVSYTFPIAQDSPSDGALEAEWTVDFNYTVIYYGTPKNACLRIFNSTDDSLVATVWNNTAIQNYTSLNYGSYTFSIEQVYKWDCLYYNTSDYSWQTESNWTLTVNAAAPRWRNRGQNATVVDQGGTLKLYAEGYDGVGLDYAWLATDETGSWLNYTSEEYGLSSASTTISGDPTDRHNFQPAHKTRVSQVNKTVDGAVRKYLAYDCDTTGNEIRLYFSNSTGGTWTAYSSNPILSGSKRYRWASVGWNGSTFHMFLVDRTDLQIERWTSTDGITFNYQEKMTITTETDWMSPFVWFNPNDDKWYLYHQEVATPNKLWARNATNIEDLDSATDVFVMDDDDINATGSDPRIGAPTVMYRNDKYWLLTEGRYDPANWAVFAFVSETSPTSGFQDCSNSPILKSGQACPQHMIDSDGESCYLFTSTDDSGSWHEDTYEVYTQSEGYHFAKDMNDVADTWTWSNFTWTNSSVPVGTEVQWRIYYNDTSGNVNCTDVYTFLVAPTTMYDPWFDTTLYVAVTVTVATGAIIAYWYRRKKKKGTVEVP